MKHRVNYLKIIVIVHGKSELCLVRYIKSNLKIKMEIISSKNGKNPIQITSLKNILNNLDFKSSKNFLKKFYDIEHIKDKLLNFKLFIIMDTDDCPNKKKDSYLTKKMFKDHWLSKYIIPIYNINNLEDVMSKCNIKITRKKDYITIFPINRNELDIEQIKNFSIKIKQFKQYTNLNEFIDYCIKICEE